MFNWSVQFEKQAQKDISILDKPDRFRVVQKIEWLGKNFDDILPSTLSANFREYFKLRVGDWRVFYQVDWKEKIIYIKYLDHRSKAYKKRK